jgi:hypothetical protein
MKTLYLNNFSGVSGDILLSALMQIVPESKNLNSLLSKTLGFPIKLTLLDCKISGVAAKRLDIEIRNENKLNYRNATDIRAIIEKSSVDEKTKIDAVEVINILARAESVVHKVPLEMIHFHEIGAIDTIIDILGVCYLINCLKPVKIISSPIKVGSGFLQTSHGIIPNPAPATLQILHGLAVEKLEIERELTTPTGAALIKYFAEDFTKTFSGILNSNCYSTGTNIFKELPNLFCLMLFKPNKEVERQNLIIEIETNIDDMAGLNFAFVHKQLLEAGALDVYFTPIYTKKNRPAYKINIICTENKLFLMSDIIFNNTTTAGVRFIEKNRIVLKREINTINYMNNRIRIKTLFYKDKVKKMPEWDDVEVAAINLNVPPHELYLKLLEYT